MGSRLIVALAASAAMSCNRDAPIAAAGAAEAGAPRPAHRAADAHIEDGTAQPARAPASGDEEYRVAGRRIRLVTEDGGCWIVLTDASEDEGTRETRGPQQRLKLAVTPPCHLLTWQGPPPERAGSPSDGVPVGALGEPQGWRYRSAKNVLVLAAIGDPVPERWLAKRPGSRGRRCASKAQGVLLRGREASLSKRLYNGLVCVETGLEEKDFWLFAHEK